LEYLPIIGDFFRILTAASAIFVVILIIGFLAVYIFNALTLMLIGKKAGLDSDWMPFVPVANSLYALKIVGEHWWKVFFFDGLIEVVISTILFLVFNQLNTIFAFVLVLLYLLCCFAYYVYYMYFYYKAFGINPTMIIAIFAGCSGLINFVIDVLIAYTNLFSYGDVYGMASNNFRFSGPAPAAGPAAAPAPAPAQAPRRPAGGPAGSITCLSGMYSGNTFNMVADEELTLGRDAAVCNIVLERNADKVSRKHCGILYNPSSQNYFVTDYSSNGTMTNDGARLVNNIPTQLPSGTIICLGNNENRFMLN
jgi:hypothetical protein